MYAVGAHSGAHRVPRVESAPPVSVGAAPDARPPRQPKNKPTEADPTAPSSSDASAMPLTSRRRTLATLTVGGALFRGAAGFLNPEPCRAGTIAEEDFSRECGARRVDPRQTTAMARELYGAGRLREAEDVLVRAIGCVGERTKEEEEEEEDPVAPMLKLLGDVRVDSYRYAAAVEAYDAAISRDPRGASAPGAHFGRGNAHEGLAGLAEMAEASSDFTAGSPTRRGSVSVGGEARREYELAVEDYGRCVELRPDDPEVGTAMFERAQAERTLGKWSAARADYDAAADAFSRRKRKREAKIAEAQAAFAAFEAGDVTFAVARLEALSRQLYSSDVRAALAACYWSMGEAAKAEDQWLGLCDMEGALCGKYVDREWLLGYRKWTPGLAESMAGFLALRVGASREP